MMWGNYGMGYGWWVMGAMMLIVTASIIGLVVWLVARPRTSPTGGGYPAGAVSAPAGAGQTAARSILDERYARGEMTTEEYRERLSNLGG